MDKLHIIKLEKAIKNITNAISNFESNNFRIGRGDLDFAIENIQEAKFSSESYEDIINSKIN